MEKSKAASKHSPSAQAKPAQVEKLRQALALCQQGRVAEAEALCQAILKSSPGNFDATHMLGVIALRVEGKIQYDPVHMKITNNAAANKYLKPTFRKGWTLT